MSDLRKALEDEAKVLIQKGLAPRGASLGRVPNSSRYCVYFSSRLYGGLSMIEVGAEWDLLYSVWFQKIQRRRRFDNIQAILGESLIIEEDLYARS